MASTLGHNVSFIMVIPIAASLRYCNGKFTRIMTFANAGHNPPLLVRKGESPSYLVTKKDLFWLVWILQNTPTVLLI